MLDELDRLLLCLVQTVQERAPDDVHRPFEVHELVQDIVPYRVLRRANGFDTNEDYEHAMSRLLAGERGYLRVDAGMQEMLAEELATPHPDTALFREYSRSHVLITATGTPVILISISFSTAPSGRSLAPPRALARMAIFAVCSRVSSRSNACQRCSP